MENIWKSNASYKQDVKEGSIFTLKDNKLGISIHHFVGCGNNWYLSCQALGISQYDLNTEDFEVAVELSKKIVSHTTNAIVENAMNFCTSESNTFTKY